ncbi:D-2-hydroxyacid dehydrogenase [Novosphingobium sp.]|uniref:D-2-hydroxyacid dehydrogenase n=1 Tax=Novosphingobium sp. TaxID=1874826 RepID=UPI0026234E98|nr:D-2-hydroxyacid dehydrogenase [Novosphingobium sp.]
MTTPSKTILVMPALAAPVLQPHLPDWIEPRFFRHTAELIEMAPEAEIGWFDLDDKAKMVEAITRAENLKWLSSIYAGVDGFPLQMMAERGVVFTNGVGINAITIAEYVVMGILNIAKGYREVVRAQDRHEWLADSPGKVELAGSKALVLGYGAIGQRVDKILSAFEVEVTKVRRSPGEGTLLPDQWRARLGEFNWVILAVPATPETDGMIGAAELAAMKPSAVLVNVARGSVVDQDALVAALTEQRIGGAFLDVTTPEPLPADHPLWSLPNAHVTMHLSGRAQTAMFQRSAARFLDNLARYGRGDALAHQVDLTLGY